MNRRKCDNECAAFHGLCLKKSKLNCVAAYAKNLNNLIIIIKIADSWTVYV